MAIDPIGGRPDPASSKPTGNPAPQPGLRGGIARLLLGIFGLAALGPAQAKPDPVDSARQQLEQRVLAARVQLQTGRDSAASRPAAETGLNEILNGKPQHEPDTGESSRNRLAQYWNNWGNFPNWPNWSNWPNR